MSLRLWNATENMEAVAASFDYAPRTEKDWRRLQRAFIRFRLALLMENGASLLEVAPEVQQFIGPRGLEHLKVIFAGVADHAR